MKALLIGYGNSMRSDDGVGCYIADKVNELVPDLVDVIKADQLTIEMADDIKDYKLVIFADANVKEDDDFVTLVELKPDYKLGATAHVLTPETLLAICQLLYSMCPKAYLLSVKAINLDFGGTLSEMTRKYAQEAVKLAIDLIKAMNPPEGKP